MMHLFPCATSVARESLRPSVQFRPLISAVYLLVVGQYAYMNTRMVLTVLYVSCSYCLRDGAYKYLRWQGRIPLNFSISLRFNTDK